MDVFMGYTKIPILIYYGDNLPETDERPELYEWTRRLHLMRKWAALLNEYGGDATVIHLPEIGLHGNTHFPFSDLNNVEVARPIFQNGCTKRIWIERPAKWTEENL